jgi:hypothetical protein
MSSSKPKRSRRPPPHRKGGLPRQRSRLQGSVDGVISSAVRLTMHGYGG